MAVTVSPFRMPTRRSPAADLYWMSSMLMSVRSHVSWTRGRGTRPPYVGWTAPLSTRPTSIGLVGMLGHGRAAAADEEVEIATLVGLQHVVQVQARVTGARRLLLVFGTVGQAGLDFLFRHVQVQATVLAIEFDEVAVLDDAQRTAGAR